MTDLYLASRSPRRRELLRQIGVRFEPLVLRLAQRGGMRPRPPAHLVHHHPAVAEDFDLRDALVTGQTLQLLQGEDHSGILGFIAGQRAGAPAPPIVDLPCWAAHNGSQPAGALPRADGAIGIDTDFSFNCVCFLSCSHFHLLVLRIA